MEIIVLIEPLESGNFRARSGEPLHLCAEGATAAEATRQLGLLCEALLAHGNQLTTLTLPAGQAAPGPGIPVSLVDSGIDVAHPEFAGRPNLVLLNDQEPPSFGGIHGTAVASVVGAQENGVGIVGIYPDSILRSWDAAGGDGTELTSSAIAKGILAASAAGRMRPCESASFSGLPLRIALSRPLRRRFGPCGTSRLMCSKARWSASSAATGPAKAPS